MTTGYDVVNRPVTLSGSLGGQATNYVEQTAYYAAGGIWYLTRGNGLWHLEGYNSRLQMTENYELFDNNGAQILFFSCVDWGANSVTNAYNLCPAPSSGANNGTVKGYTAMHGYPQFLTVSQTFGYDNLNRLTAASENGAWAQTYNYDQYGNMWMPNNGGLTVNGAMPTTNVYSANGPGNNQNPNVSYDAAGNQKAFGALGLTYDAENRQVAATNTLGGGTATYNYDGVGQRVEKVLPGATTLYVYDAFGQLAAEYSTAASQPPPCTTCYLSYDYLGSVRLVTDQNRKIVARHDYAPFGQEIPAGVGGRTAVWGASGNVNQKFTGQERDAETNLDFFQARYMSAGLGRFMSPDPANAGADITNPQSWNGYAYVGGNPLIYTDPSGEDFGGFLNWIGVFSASAEASQAIARALAAVPTVAADRRQTVAATSAVRHQAALARRRRRSNILWHRALSGTS